MRFAFPMASAIALLVPSAFSAPIYYTFSGQVTSSQYAGIAVGQAVSYTFKVDFDLAGYSITDGEAQLLADDPSSGVDWFLADYVSGDAIANDPGFAVSAESQYGFIQGSGAGAASALRGSNADPSGLDFIWIAGSGHIADWAVGQSVTGQNQIASSQSPYSFTVNSDLTLSSISGGPDVAAVPEPTGLFLVGAGLLGMGACARRPKRT